MKDKEVSKKRYINVPLILLRDVHLDYKRGMDGILTYGLGKFAFGSDFGDHDIARQAIYDYYHNKATKPLKELYTQLIEEETLEDGDYSGFDIEGKMDYIQVDRVCELFEDNAEFYSAAKTNCQIHGLNSFIKSTGFILNKDNFISNFDMIDKRIMSHEKSFGKDAYSGIDIEILIDFMSNSDDMELFAAYMAIKSLQGKRDYVESTKSVILMRMYGAKSQNVLDHLLMKQEIKELYDQYIKTEKTIRYYMDKWLKQLLDRGLLRSKIFIRGVSRKIFLSTRMDYEQLTPEIIQVGKKRNHKKKESDARGKIELGLDDN